jgi:hypothetical protein
MIKSRCLLTNGAKSSMIIVLIPRPLAGNESSFCAVAVSAPSGGISNTDTAQREFFILR